MPARKIRYNGPTPLIAIPQVYLDELKVDRGATMSVELGENYIIVRPMGVAQSEASNSFNQQSAISNQQSVRPTTKPVKAYIPSWVKDGEKLHEQEGLSRDTPGSDTPASDAGAIDDRPRESDGTGELNSGSGDTGAPTGEQPE